MTTGDIGRRIRAVRKNTMQITQEDLARRSNVSMNVIARIERGEINDPHVSTLTRISEALEVPVGTLLYGEDVPKGSAPRSSSDRERRILKAWSKFLDLGNEDEVRSFLDKVARYGVANPHDDWPMEIIGTVTSKMSADIDREGVSSSRTKG